MPNIPPKRKAILEAKLGLWSSLTRTPIMVLGHRGYPTKYPENSLASLLAAVFYGAHGVELDVWSSSDGRPVLHHDRTTGRVAGEDLDITQTPYPRLKRLLLGKGQALVSLEEVLEAYPQDKILMIEVKDRRAVEGIRRLVERYRTDDNTYIVSFDPLAISEFMRDNAGVRLGLNFDVLSKVTVGSVLRDKYRLHFVGFPITAVPQVGEGEARRLVAKARSRGLKIMFWSPLELAYNPDYLFTRYRELVDIAVVNDPASMVKKLLSPADKPSQHTVGR